MEGVWSTFLVGSHSCEALDGSGCWSGEIHWMDQTASGSFKTKQ